MEPIRVLIADDHGLVLAGILALLQGIDGVEVVAQAGDGREVLCGSMPIKPYVLLPTDIAMPQMNGLDLAEWVAREWLGDAGGHPQHARHRGVRQPGALRPARWATS